MNNYINNETRCMPQWSRNNFMIYVLGVLQVRVSYKLYYYVVYELRERYRRNFDSSRPLLWCVYHVNEVRKPIALRSLTYSGLLKENIDDLKRKQ